MPKKFTITPENYKSIIKYIMSNVHVRSGWWIEHKGDVEHSYAADEAYRALPSWNPFESELWQQQAVAQLQAWYDTYLGNKEKAKLQAALRKAKSQTNLKNDRSDAKLTQKAKAVLKTIQAFENKDLSRPEHLTYSDIIEKYLAPIADNIQKNKSNSP